MMKKILALLSLALVLSTGLPAQGPTPSQARGFQVGGLLYAGNFPINNPANTGDVGYAVLYVIDGSYIFPVDTVIFDSLGYYYFFNVIQGLYLVKAGLKPGSAHFDSYLPAYYGDAGDWTHADTLWVTGDQYAANIRMIPVTAAPMGERSVNGFVSSAEQPENDPRIPGCEVVLADTLYHPLACTYSDASGAFSFTGMADGTYFIFAEYTGKYSQKAQVVLDAIHPVSDSIEVKVFTPSLGIGTLSQGDPLRLTLSPNPANGRVTMVIESAGKDLTIRLCSLLGKEVITRQVKGVPGSYTGTLNLEGLRPGIYIFSASGPSPGSQVMKKLIVY